MVREYERLWEEAQGRLEQLESAAGPTPSALSLFTDDTWSELTDLCRDLRSIFWGLTTTHRDRKQLISTVVEAVIVEKRTKERILARIVWANGDPDTRLDIKQSPYAHRRIGALHRRGKDVAAIVAALNEEGLFTRQGNPWTADSVR